MVRNTLYGILLTTLVLLVTKAVAFTGNTTGTLTPSTNVAQKYESEASLAVLFTVQITQGGVIPGSDGHAILQRRNVGRFVNGAWTTTPTDWIDVNVHHWENNQITPESFDYFTIAQTFGIGYCVINRYDDNIAAGKYEFRAIFPTGWFGGRTFGTSDTAPVDILEADIVDPANHATAKNVEWAPGPDQDDPKSYKVVALPPEYLSPSHASGKGIMVKSVSGTATTIPPTWGGHTVILRDYPNPNYCYTMDVPELHIAEAWRNETVRPTDLNDDKKWYGGQYIYSTYGQNSEFIFMSILLDHSARF
jgi:hypothetical protein